ncbi:MAG: phosphate acyltransferase [Candidatus Atribacteria bacterium]|nr:phosphate acyltransferase [Candidatus Atribacteria bacterium]
MTRIVVDGMGGDFAPLEVLEGVKAALSPGRELLVLGPREKLQPFYQQLGLSPERVPIIDAPQVIEMEEQATEAVRKKPDSSICRGIKLVSQKKVDAFISAGNSGAVMTAAWLGLPRIADIERPAITALIPNPSSYTVLLDVGANVDCKPKHLLHFGVMGAEYARIILNLDRPRVGVLNIGEEEGKGNELAKLAYQFFSQKKEVLNFHFEGNAEGHNIVDGTMDVVVCDGFTGNALLKFGEGLLGLVNQFLKEEIKVDDSLGKLKEIWKRFDSSEYGGAPLLGVEGVCLICHGKSRARDIKSAIIRAEDLVRQGISEKIRDGISRLQLREKKR